MCVNFFLVFCAPSIRMNVEFANCVIGLKNHVRVLSLMRKQYLTLMLDI